MKRIIGVSIISIVSIGLLLFSGASFGRLNVPGSEATSGEYALFVLLPALFGVCGGVASRIIGFFSGKLPVPNAIVKAPGGVISQSIAYTDVPLHKANTLATISMQLDELAKAGDPDAAKALIEAREGIKRAIGKVAK